MADAVRVGRRQFVTTATAGALLGSAWGLALRETLGESGRPTVTVAMGDACFSALIEHHHRRVLLLDGALQEEAAELADIVTGVMRQRIDLLLVSPEGAALLPSAFVDRWRIQRVLEMAGGNTGAASTLSGRALRIGDVTVTPARQTLGAWRYATADVPSPWFVTVAYGASQVIIASTGAALDRLPFDSSSASCLITFDEIERLPPGAIIDALAAPAGASLSEIIGQRPEVMVVPIRRRTPLSIAMDRGGIEMPTDG